VYSKVGVDTVAGFTDTDAIGVVAVSGSKPVTGRLHHLVLAVVGITGGYRTVFGFRQGIAVIVISVVDTSGLQQPVVVVVGIARSDAVDGFLRSVADGVILVTGLVQGTSIGRCLGFTDQTVQIVVTVTVSRAIHLFNGGTAACGIEGVVKSCNSCIQTLLFF